MFVFLLLIEQRFEVSHPLMLILKEKAQHGVEACGFIFPNTIYKTLVIGSVTKILYCERYLYLM